jgi:hypothetical protein
MNKIEYQQLEPSSCCKECCEECRKAEIPTIAPVTMQIPSAGVIQGEQQPEFYN